MDNIYCYTCFNCGKNSHYSIDVSIGTTAAYLNEEGWQLKAGILYTGKGDFMLFCSNECRIKGMRDYFKFNGVVEEGKKKVSKLIDELEEDLPAASKQISYEFKRLQRFLNKRKYN